MFLSGFVAHPLIYAQQLVEWLGIDLSLLLEVVDKGTEDDAVVNLADSQEEEQEEE